MPRSGSAPVVDAQVHVWLPEGPDRPWPPGGAERALAMHRKEPITGAALLAEMREAGVGAGPEQARVYLARATHVAPTDEQAWAEAEGPYKDFLGYADRLRRAQSGNDPGGRSPFDLDADLRDSALFGSPDTVLGRLREIHGLGIGRVMLFLHMGGLAHEKIMSSLDLLAREVLPVVREW